MSAGRIKLQKSIMEKDLIYVKEMQNICAQRGILFVNLIGSPGAGKTTLLEETLKRMEFKAAVIEGDIATSKDADRIKALGFEAVQINTNGSCHLEAHQILKKTKELNIDGLDILFVENVGNLVCPAEFDIGEDFKVAVSSTPEGEDKPMKYPLLFTEAKAVVLTKIDIIPYVSFDEKSFWDDIRRLNPHIEAIRLNAISGEGLDAWMGFLRRKIEDKRNKNK